MFNEALEAFGCNLREIEGYWRGRGDLTSNYIEYWNNIGKKISKEDAAANTYMGRWATEQGYYPRYVDDSFGSAEGVIARFARS